MKRKKYGDFKDKLKQNQKVWIGNFGDNIEYRGIIKGIHYFDHSGNLVGYIIKLIDKIPGIEYTHVIFLKNFIRIRK